jgi:hypothetical protein
VSSLAVSLICFVFILSSLLLGMVVRKYLPNHHLSEESSDAMKLGIGVVATLAALVLGLLTASAKGTFDTMTSELRQTGEKIVLLDRLMAQYGPETKEARDLLRYSVKVTLRRIWPEDSGGLSLKQVNKQANYIEEIQAKLHQLSPANDTQRWLQSHALQTIFDMSEGRLLLTQQAGQSSLSVPMLALLVWWLAIIFFSFGLFSPFNATVICILLVCVVSATGALFLVLEMDQPYDGLIKLSSAPLHNALANLGH